MSTGGYLGLAPGTVPPTPPTGYVYVWLDTGSGTLKQINSSAVITDFIGPQGNDGIGWVGTSTVPTFTDNGDGSISIPSCKLMCYTDATKQAFHTITIAANPALFLIDGAWTVVAADTATLQYVSINANTITNDLDFVTYYPIGNCYRNGTHIHRQPSPALSNTGAESTYNLRHETRRYSLSAGLNSLAIDTTSGAMTLNSGRVWADDVAYDLNSITNTSDYFYNYVVSGVYQNPVHSIGPVGNNSQYSDGSNIQSLDTGFWNVLYVFRGVENENHMYGVMGIGEFATSAIAKASNVVPPLPNIIEAHAFFVGRIISQQGTFANSFAESAFTTTFNGSSSISQHNLLGGLQGGSANQYYHLTLAQYTSATQNASGSQDGLLSAADWSTFDNKQPALGYTPAHAGSNSDITSLSALSTPLSVSQGGTGQTTKQAAFDALSPSATKGDLIAYSGTHNVNLAVGTDGQVLTAQSGATPGVAWLTPSATIPAILAYGDGSDGNVTVSSGTTTLARDMYYNNLTINGTGKINPGGFAIFVSGTLDLTAAPAGAISVAGGTGSTGGSGGPAGPVGGGAVGSKAFGAGNRYGSTSGTGTGGTGNLNNGTSGGGANANGYSNGGNAGTSGAGGAGSVGSGGGATGINSINAILFQRFVTDFFMSGTVISAGVNGPGGGGGGGDNSATYGGGGGGGGGGGCIIAIFANIISRGGSTTAGAITAAGGTGGTGGPGATNAGGGGGGVGGGGGWIYIAYGSLSGTTATNCIDVSGGGGGTGGTAGTGGLGGNGGGSAYSGRITLINLSSGATSNTVPSAGASGTAHSGTTGGAGAAVNTKQVNL